MREPQQGDVWQHAEGGEYVIVARAVNKDRDRLSDDWVVYCRHDDPRYYIRSLANFLERFSLRFSRQDTTCQ